MKLRVYNTEEDAIVTVFEVATGESRWDEFEVVYVHDNEGGTDPASEVDAALMPIVGMGHSDAAQRFAAAAVEAVGAYSHGEADVEDVFGGIDAADAMSSKTLLRLYAAVAQDLALAFNATEEDPTQGGTR